MAEADKEQLEQTSQQATDTIDVDNKCLNPGNPVFSCEKGSTPHNNALVTQKETKETLARSQHPMYTTTSNSYGEMHPTIETLPISFHGRSQKFSLHLANSGMYRNQSLNTSADHSRV